MDCRIKVDETELSNKDKQESFLLYSTKTKPNDDNNFKTMLNDEIYKLKKEQSYEN